MSSSLKGPLGLLESIGVHNNTMWHWCSSSARKTYCPNPSDYKRWLEMFLCKLLHLGLICPQDERLWFTQVRFGVALVFCLCQQWGRPGSPAVAFHFIYMSTIVRAPSACRKAWISLELVWGCSLTIRTILHCNLSSIVLFHPRPGRLATEPRVANFLILRNLDVWR